jgi:hypothetical protein
MSVGTTPVRETVVDLPKLERDLRAPRTLFSYAMSVVTGAMTVLATVPLFSVLVLLIYRGGSKLSLSLFTELPPAAGMSTWRNSAPKRRSPSPCGFAPNFSPGCRRSWRACSSS